MHIKQLLNHWSLLYIYYNTVSTLDPGEVILAVKEHINDRGIYRNGEEKISSLSKMRTYRNIKSDFSMEKYLSLPSHLRSALAKFRD